MVSVMFVVVLKKKALLGKAGALLFYILVYACQYTSGVALYIAL